MLTIRKLMHDATLTQEELAELAEISPACISQYVNGKVMPQKKNLMKLANALDWNRDPKLLFADANDYHEGYGQEEIAPVEKVFEPVFEEKQGKPTGSEIKGLISAVKAAESDFDAAKSAFLAAQEALNEAEKALNDALEALD